MSNSLSRFFKRLLIFNFTFFLIYSNITFQPENDKDSNLEKLIKSQPESLLYIFTTNIKINSEDFRSKLTFAIESITNTEYYKNNIITKYPSSDNYIKIILNYINHNYILIYQVLLSTFIISAFFSILFDVKLLGLLYTLLFGFYSLVMLNPLLPENRIEATYGILRKELVLSVGVVLILLVNVFKPRE